MFSTREPKPTLLSSRELPKLLSIAEVAKASSLQQYLSTTVGPKNRFTHQEKMLQVENYICETFRDFGWKTERQRYHYESFNGYTEYNIDETNTGGPKQYHDLKGVNIIATKPGKNADQTIIIGAHYDTISNTPGADDNGTGIAALLELARVLGKHSYSKTLMLVAFDMEEIGFAGSQAFVEKLSPSAVVDGVIIFETVGYFDEKENSQKIPSGFSLLYRQQIGQVKKNLFKGDFITVIHNGKSKKLASLIAGANQSLKAIPLVFIRDPLDLPILGVILKRLFPVLKNLLRSDHVPFWQEKLPAIQLTDTANFRNPNYHRPTDTLDTVNFHALQRLVQIVAVATCVLAGVQE
jgi:hypothetical protein